jgi:hypothetical protein
MYKQDSKQDYAQDVQLYGEGGLREHECYSMHDQRHFLLHLPALFSMMKKIPVEDSVFIGEYAFVTNTFYIIEIMCISKTV